MAALADIARRIAAALLGAVADAALSWVAARLAWVVVALCAAAALVLLVLGGLHGLSSGVLAAGWLATAWLYWAERCAARSSR